MKHDQFKIGNTFFASAGFEWKCTDKGSRTITAIMLDPTLDASWFVGPSYALSEVVFDEYDINACYLDDDEMLLDRIANLGVSAHPNFLGEDVTKMIKEKRSASPYPRKNLLKRDRVSPTGEILHPYAAIMENGKYYIKTFELFSRQYSQMCEDDFKNLALNTEEAMKNRKTSFNAK